jgi:hypothetical protein
VRDILPIKYPELTDPSMLTHHVIARSAQRNHGKIFDPFLASEISGRVPRRRQAFPVQKGPGALHS